MVVFKMRDNVPSPRYLPVCNILRQWKTSLISTYRVYQLYDMHAKGFLNPNSPIFQPNCAEGLYFSAFHYYSISMDSEVNDLPGPRCKQSKSGNFFNTYTLI